MGLSTPDQRPPIRVVLVDDQAIVRSGLLRILSPTDGFEVVAQFGDGADAAVAFQDAQAPLEVDVVVMDIRMPRLDGIEATRRIRSISNPPAVLMLTTFDEDDLLWPAIEAGASGFVLKDISADALIAAVTAVAGGGAWFDPAVAPRVLETYRRTVSPLRRDAGSAAALIAELTQREREVLTRMARGATNIEIGADLFVSEATVKTHVGNIFAKLGARDRAAAIVFAFDHGLV